jgi:hypothetical protein
MSGPPIPPDRWHRIEEIFRSALELPEEQRDTFLRESCGADSELQSDVQRLLASDDRESPVIGGIIDNATAGLLGENNPEDEQ